MADGSILFQWMVDTREWYSEVDKVKDLRTAASDALAFLTPDYQEPIFSQHFVKDAKMVLASALLKHYAVTRLTGTPWRAVGGGLSRNRLKKPIFRDAAGVETVRFNVSHQSGLVAIAAVATRDYPAGDVEIGVDVVCTSERRTSDHSYIARDGWPAFVDTFAEVFAPEEERYLKNRVLYAVPGLLPPNATDEEVSDGRLRAFYSLWAMREAYVKLTGVALLADWLRLLEFRDFIPPRPSIGWGTQEGFDVIGDTEMYFKGVRVRDISLSLRSLGDDFMFCTAIRTPSKVEDGLSWPLKPYEKLTLEDVLDMARMNP
ncbi:hypothetical protein C8A05DRAFT_43119 [Staphylotrichum tortipilum]|uniref:holo-[acyl-carrier-protein] synthase n=1 Tax=Staphylotrichum tortipilum TaxID=2831512 RepID=A0AAN6RUP4_9PEZI|nr:hypothetical protein C8A05DRAFT_43119 [Staphylotrichum longicolle]